MMRVLRSLLGVIAGFVMASVVMMAVEYANAHFFYPDFAKLAEAKDKQATQDALASAPEGTTADSPLVLKRRRGVVKELLAGAPVGALLVVALGWVLGSVAGGFVAAWIGRRAPVVHGLVLGGLLTLAGIANNLMLPPPLWFWIATLVVFVPSAYFGARLAPKKSMQATAG
jgi:hypothetical protein